jgi:hypothetical protein
MPPILIHQSVLSRLWTPHKREHDAAYALIFGRVARNSTALVAVDSLFRDVLAELATEYGPDGLAPGIAGALFEDVRRVVAELESIGSMEYRLNRALLREAFALAGEFDVTLQDALPMTLAVISEEPLFLADDELLNRIRGLAIPRLDVRPVE